ncbi:DUF5984 family protein [Bradyrhizobium icense]|uniref:Uncharacterized protein n=1 Tax=Bradyrhizobium icense TaxID=1274631 RepID=A0A1B1UHZ4_9BRAD|nr:DUF5984 family protein [Bradyrhizobium icense]ANW02365.1 hypothetical protein LMTR13_21500 [Bradyrhizobium icense]
MLINFNLTPIEEIVPWGQPGSHSLHWFGLTYGEYWIQAGDAALFEYSDHARNAGAKRYCDYQVVRLYEDLMEILPSILEPVPEPLVPYICGEPAKAWQNAYDAWRDRSDDVLDTDYFCEVADAAVAWSGKRRLDSTYLSPSANIAIWSDQEHVHIEWDNRDRHFDGKPAWSAVLGSYQMPRDEFIEEMKSFHVRLMDQMAARVDQVVAGRLPSDIQIDLPGLVREHEQRGRSLDSALRFVPQTDWQQTERAIREILMARGGV